MKTVYRAEHQETGGGAPCSAFHRLSLATIPGTLAAGSSPADKSDDVQFRKTWAFDALRCRTEGCSMPQTLNCLPPLHLRPRHCLR